MNAGCTAVAKDAGFSEVQKAMAGRLDQRVEWNRNTAEDAAVSEAVRQMLQTELGVDETLQIALLNNRNLQATYEDLGIAQADLVQAGLLRNPILSFERRFSGQAAEFDAVQDFVEALLIPLRKRVAGAAFELAKLRVAGVVVSFAVDVRAAFYRLQGAEQMLAMRRAVVDSTEASAELSRRLRVAGNITELALRMEERLASQARLDLATADEDVVELHERLNVLMGLWGSDTAWTLARGLPDLPAREPSAQGLESQAVAQRLDMAAARQDIIAAAERLGLTSISRLVPGGSVGFHYEHEPDPFFSIGPSLHWVLPIFDWGQGAVPRDRAVLRQSQQRYIALAIEARSQVRAAYSRMRTARDRAEFYRQMVLPLQGDILRQAQLQYNAMILGPLQLLQAKQGEIDTGRDYIEAQRDYWVTRTELERALGGRFDNAMANAEVPPATLFNGSAKGGAHIHTDTEVDQ
ncbi:MAG: TolC family protein [Deltaproteobacteria bacterium]|nr:TolC family protein [Deltaproteobacteria bacterium]